MCDCDHAKFPARGGLVLPDLFIITCWKYAQSMAELLFISIAHGIILTTPAFGRTFMRKGWRCMCHIAEPASRSL